jgi:ketosteroid isomerase-like protein
LRRSVSIRSARVEALSSRPTDPAAHVADGSQGVGGKQSAGNGDDIRSKQGTTEVYMNNKQRLQAIFNAFVAGDSASVDAAIHPDFVITEAPGLPYGGTYRGLDGWHRLVGNIVGTWDDFATAPIEILGEPDGDRFAALHSLKGRSKKTGRSVSLQVFELWVFKDHKVIEVVPFYFDTHAVAKACDHDR